MINSQELRLRAIMLLSACKQAGLCPISQRALHNLAFYCNTLSSVFNLDTLDGKVLRLKDGPYYPDLQDQIDYLIFSGKIQVKDFSINAYKKTKNDIRFDIDLKFSFEVISKYEIEINDKRTYSFIKELALSFSSFDDLDIEKSCVIDAVYSDNSTGYGNVIDFAEWRNFNPSYNVTNFIEEHNGIPISENNKISLYIRQLQHYLNLGNEKNG